MKFIASSTELLSHLQAISRVINNKSTFPILENFLFDLNGNTLTLTASDMETTLVTTMNVENAEGKGKVALTAKLLLDTLREFPEQPLEFDINDSNLAMVIKSANGSYNFIGQNGDEYPRLPDLQADVRQLVLPVDTLAKGVFKTIFATASDELRPVMNGIFFDIDANGLTFVATDAHKLVRFKTNYSSASVKGDERESFILPQKPATMLKNILPKESGDVTIEFDNKNTRFKLENYTMVCRQVEGRFPNYNGVIPKENPHKIIVDRLTILNALKRVSVFSNQASNLIKLSISTNQIQISAQDIDFSISAEEHINCQYSGENINIGFKSSFLIEILNNMDVSEVVFELAEPSRAGLILPFEKVENESLLMLLMPMLLND